MFKRRQILAGTALLAAPAILRAQSWFSKYPFGLGVTSGDPAPDGFVIWTRIAPEPFEPHGGMPIAHVPVTWEIADSTSFRNIVAKGETIARPELGHSVHVEVTGLEPGREYRFRFFCGGERSPYGRAQTLPAARTSIDRLRFGVCGCQHYETGYFTAYRHLASEDLAFVFHYGDFIYEYSYDYNYDRNGAQLLLPKVRNHRIRNVMSLGDYRAHYAQYLLDPDLQAARARHTFLQTFDDHEVSNNWTGQVSQDDELPPEDFAFRKQAAFQAWYEHMPVRRALLPHGPSIHANRALDYGTLAAINLLDTRSFRTNQPCGDAMKPSCPGQFDPAADVLGKAQEAWLDANLGQKDAIWNCIAQQVMMMPLDRRTTGSDAPDPIYNMDSWAGYTAPRERLMARLAKVENAVVLTGDEHQNYAGLLLSKDKPVAAESVVTSITSGGDGQDMRPGSQRILDNNPQLKLINDQRGYGVCEVTPEAWQTHFMVLDKVSTPDGTLSRRATATVPRGPTTLEIS